MCRAKLPHIHQKYTPRFYFTLFESNPPKAGEKWTVLSYEDELRPGYFYLLYSDVTLLLFFSHNTHPPNATIFGKSLSTMNYVFDIVFNLILKSNGQ